MWCWLCRLWDFLVDQQTDYDPFSRSDADWWRSLTAQNRAASRDEIEALEQIRDQWRR